MKRLALLALLLGGCAVDAAAHPNACGDGDSCPDGRHCVHPDGVDQGFCVVDEVVGCEPVAEICNGADDDCDDRVDETFDLTAPERCGDCDTTCSPPNAMCLPDGAGGFFCGSECDRTRFTDCGADLCIDPMTDERHCGGCGVQCDPGEDCVGGQCRCGGAADGEDCAGTAASTCCGTRCVNINTDSENCGVCGGRCARSGGSRVACEDAVCGCGDCREPDSCLNLLVMECL